MNFSKHSLVASSLLLLLGMNSFADEVYTIQNKTLKEALEIISKKSNLSYIANDEVLDRKSTNNIEDIEGTQQALDKLLEGSGLKAIIDDKSIVIVKEQGVVKVINGTYVLDDVSVKSGGNGSAENGYVTKEISGIGLWDKRSLQDTPYQMSVISQDMLENSASGIEQVFKMNPTVQVRYTTTQTDSWGGAIGMNIRGFSTVDNTIIDGIPISSYYGGGLSQDLERVEILNGLSGFLYGVGYVGGAVNYVTKRPTLDRLTNLTIGSTGNQAFYGHIDLGGKIDEDGKFSYRLNAFKQNGETSIKDQEVDNTMISGALDWRATDNLIFTFDASHKKSKTDKLTASFSSNDAIGKLDPKQGYAPDWTFSDTSHDKLGFKSLWQVNDNIKLRTGYIYTEYERDTSQSWVYDNYDGTYRFNYFKIYPEESKKQGAYVYTDFDFNTFGVDHTLTMGVSGTKNKSYSNNTEWVNLGNYTLNQLNHISKPTYLGNSNNPNYLSSISEKTNFMIGDDIRFNDQWSALVGLNYAKTESDSYNQSGTRTGGYDADEVTPTLSLIFKPFEDLTTYATYMESLENGTDLKNCANCIDRDKVLDPYVSKQYEVGAKYSVYENLLLSSALFRIEKANRYEEKLPNNMVDVNQDGLVIHQGFELTATGKVTDNLTIVGGGTFLDLEIDKANANEGKKPTATASKMAKLYAEYNLPFIQGLTVTGGAYYTGKSYRDGANTDIIPSYTIYDAGLRYKTKIDKFPTTFIVNATNLTNKKYWRGSTSFGEPTNLAFSMKMEF
ncbi:TonB-dependent siderophore receptor [Arcobacter sp. FW59]|nr:TonB-dependent siderophore receptor [Arcobacter sp. FW59]